MCGEKCTLFADVVPTWGSPPHVRGKVNSKLGAKAESGITPACAGKRQGLAKVLSQNRDHPRMCGEKPGPDTASKVAGGSPPHVRGKVCQLENHQMVVGITPACAGKSLSSGQ